MTTTTKQTAMSLAEFVDCDLHSGAALARIRAALEQRERLLEACKAAILYLRVDVETEEDEGREGFATETHDKLRAAIAAAEGY